MRASSAEGNGRLTGVTRGRSFDDARDYSPARQTERRARARGPRRSRSSFPRRQSEPAYSALPWINRKGLPPRAAIPAVWRLAPELNRVRSRNHGVFSPIVLRRTQSNRALPSRPKSFRGLTTPTMRRVVSETRALARHFSPAMRQPFPTTKAPDVIPVLQSHFPIPSHGLKRTTKMHSPVSRGVLPLTQRMVPAQLSVSKSLPATPFSVRTRERRATVPIRGPNWTPGPRRRSPSDSYPHRSALIDHFVDTRSDSRSDLRKPVRAVSRQQQSQQQQSQQCQSINKRINWLPQVERKKFVSPSDSGLITNAATMSPAPVSENLKKSNFAQPTTTKGSIVGDSKEKLRTKAKRQSISDSHIHTHTASGTGETHDETKPTRRESKSQPVLPTGKRLEKLKRLLGVDPSVMRQGVIQRPPSPHLCAGKYVHAREYKAVIEQIKRQKDTKWVATADLRFYIDRGHCEFKDAPVELLLDPELRQIQVLMLRESRSKKPNAQKWKPLLFLLAPGAELGITKITRQRAPGTRTVYQVHFEKSKEGYPINFARSVLRMNQWSSNSLVNRFKKIAFQRLIRRLIRKRDDVHAAVLNGEVIIAPNSARDDMNLKAMLCTVFGARFVDLG